jgi:uncharacterized protein (TIGR02284 family)
MSTDEKTTKSLMKTLEDGREGMEKAAAKLAESDSPLLAETFRTLGRQRGEMYGELQTLAQAYGDDIEESGSVVAALHRGWMTVKDTLTGSSPKGVLEAAEKGEDHSVAAYEEALSEDISPTLRSVVERQFVDVRKAHEEIRVLRDSFAA